MAGIIIIIFIITMISIIASTTSKVKEKRHEIRQTHEHNLNQLNNSGFHVDREISFKDISLFVDDNNKEFAVQRNNGNTLAIYNYNALLDFELSDNGDGGSKGSFGGAVAGGLLFGGAGAIVGPSMGSSTTCTSLQIRLVVNDISCPEIILDFLGMPFKRNSIVYQDAFKAAKSFCGLLSFVMNNKQSTYQYVETVNDFRPAISYNVNNENKNQRNITGQR